MEINAHCLGFCNNCKYRWFERKLSNSTHMKTGKSNNSHNFLSPCFSSSLCPPVTYTSFVYGKVTVWSCCGVHQGHEDHTRLELPHPTMQGGVSIHPLAQGSISNSIQRAQPQRQAVMAPGSAWSPVTRWVHNGQSGQQGRTYLEHGLGLAWARLQLTAYSLLISLLSPPLSPCFVVLKAVL